MSHPQNDPPASQDLPGCPSGKVAYDRRTEAGQAARHIRARGSSPVEPYGCPHCGQWHLRSAVGGKRRR
jgi:hypothetical protein